MITDAPSDLNNLAVALPIPEAPPVIKATFPFSLLIVITEYLKRKRLSSLSKNLSHTHSFMINI